MDIFHLNLETFCITGSSVSQGWCIIVNAFEVNTLFKICKICSMMLQKNVLQFCSVLDNDFFCVYGAQVTNTPLSCVFRIILYEIWMPTCL